MRSDELALFVRAGVETAGLRIDVVDGGEEIYIDEEAAFFEMRRGCRFLLVLS